MTSLKLNTIHKGDCLELLDKIEAGTVDMVFADPPYNLSGKTLNLKGSKTGGDWLILLLLLPRVMTWREENGQYLDILLAGTSLHAGIWLVSSSF